MSQKKGKTNINNNNFKASVTYGLGATLNAGDYESVRVNFSMSLECPINEIDKTIKKVKQKVQAQMRQEIANLKELIK